MKNKIKKRNANYKTILKRKKKNNNKIKMKNIQFMKDEEDIVLTFATDWHQQHRVSLNFNDF